MVLGETPRGLTRFWSTTSSSVAQHLDHDTTDDLLVKGPIRVHHGLLVEDQGLQDKALLDAGLPTDPLGCRWRVLLSWAQNPSRVLTFYQDQLDAQTYDQVHIRCNVLLLTI